MKTFIDVESLKRNLNKENIRIADCRFNLGKPNEGASLYMESHIPGAVYFHLEKDLSASVGEHGGRHPLPHMEDFKSVLENAGIRNDTTVIAYDGGEGAFAARFWWLLKYVGHQQVYILDGGYKEWVEAGYLVETTVPKYASTHYQTHIQSEMLASYDDVKQAINTGDCILIDSRDRKRYLGIEEAVDKKAGHIPTAINYVWTEGFQNGKFKSAAEQAKRFVKLDKENPIIVYCGSGVTATPNYIALNEAEFLNLKLYAGSFSDWISYDENEVATGDTEEE